MCKYNSQSDPSKTLSYSKGSGGRSLVLAVACSSLFCSSILLCRFPLNTGPAPKWPNKRLWRRSKCWWPEHFAEEGYLNWVSEHLLVEAISHACHRVFSTISSCPSSFAFVSLRPTLLFLMEIPVDLALGSQSPSSLTPFSFFWCIDKLINKQEKYQLT